MIAGSLLLGRALAPIDKWSEHGRSHHRENQFMRVNINLRKLPPVPEKMDLPIPSGHLSVENIIVIPRAVRQPC